MNKGHLEMEVKFCLSDMDAFEQRLRSLGASLVQPRTYETNLRFDTPKLELTKNHRVLRLRKDEKSHLTYKGPAQYSKTVSVRQEYEVEVSDFKTTEELLNALGYQVSVRYEKWRTKYHIAKIEIDLDEMPFGNFIEIEGTDPAEIEHMARALALDWNLRITDSYMMLFERFKKNKHVDLTNLDFESFKDIKTTPEDLGIKPADIIAYL